MRMRALLPVCSLIVVALTWELVAPSARAQGRPKDNEDALDEAVEDGDIDAEDRALAGDGRERTGREPTAGVGVSSERGQSWVGAVGFVRELASGRRDSGAMVVVGLALDRIVAGPTHRLDGSPAPLAPPVPWAPGPTASPVAWRQSAATVQPNLLASNLAGSRARLREPRERARLLARQLAKECVAAALRASGLGEDESRIDGLIARARESAWLPETRMRAMRLVTDAAHTTTLATTDGTTYYDAAGANLALELRLTWRLDRLMYAGDEPGLERARLERHEARGRLAARALDLLFAWQRAKLHVSADATQTQESGAEADAEANEGDGESGPLPQALVAELRVSQIEASLDALTGGWLSRRIASQSSSTRANAEARPPKDPP